MRDFVTGQRVGANKVLNAFSQPIKAVHVAWISAEEPSAYGCRRDPHAEFSVGLTATQAVTSLGCTYRCSNQERHRRSAWIDVDVEPAPE